MNSRWLLMVCVASGLLALGGSAAYAQAGSLDPTFGTNGIATSSAFVSPTAAALDAADNIIIGGTNGSIGTPGQMTRILANGALDTTFGAGGVVTTSIPVELRGLTVQADGKIVAVGYNNTYAGTQQQIVVARYNTDGSPDTSFGSGGMVSTTVYEYGSEAQVALQQPDGKLLVGGAGLEQAVIRYNTDGSLDSSFGSGGIAQFGGVEAVLLALQSDGSILVDGASGGGLQELNAGGVLQSGVKVGTIIAISRDGGIAMLPNGETILPEMEQLQRRPIEEDSELVEFLVNGIKDARFYSPAFFFVKQPKGAYEQSLIGSVALQSDGKILGGGFSNPPGVFALARFKKNGAFDKTFGTKGKVLTPVLSGSSIAQLVIQSSGKVVAVGQATDGTNEYLALARYLTQ
jgi:uncharacterized delta-60 repeat protein